MKLALTSDRVVTGETYQALEEIQLPITGSVPAYWQAIPLSSLSFPCSAKADRGSLQNRLSHGFIRARSVGLRLFAVAATRGPDGRGPPLSLYR